MMRALHVFLAYALLLLAGTMTMLSNPAEAADDLAQPGVSRELAIARAQRYRNVRYDLDIVLAGALDEVRGRLVLRFDTAAPDIDAILDWRAQPGARLSDVSVNGSTIAAPRIEREHLIVERERLVAGTNTIELQFAAPIASAGTALTRFHDAEDGSQYVYSLFVPADASSVFPCFDQPDLKARFTLAASVPAGWRMVSNAPESNPTEEQSAGRFRFAATEPISTYQFAFAAGPFATLEESGMRLFVRRARLERARSESQAVFGLARSGADWLAAYFAHPFPFAKYDLMLIPELAYGGMEHAGATFLREDSVLFPFQPAQADLLRRAQLIFHETAHQWFGDLITMRWFDDLWLKEGFANFMAAKMTAALLPGLDAWNAFRVTKLAAYRTDVTPGTTPIWQALANLNAAKSAYGNIVYSKAPAVLRQAEFFLGEAVFRDAVRDLVAQRAYGATDWHDLLASFERHSGRDLDAWGAQWVTRRGLALVRVHWDIDAQGNLREVSLTQTDALGEGGVWPMRLELAMGMADGSIERMPVALDGASVKLPALEGRPAPRFIYANAGDFGYGIFVLDARSRDYLTQHIGQVSDALLRALLWDGLWESVRFAEMAPADYLDAVLRELPQERDELTLGVLLARLQTVSRWYLSDAQRAAIAPALERTLEQAMMQGATAGMRIVAFRAFAATVSTPAGAGRLKALLSGAMTVPGVSLTSNDRFRLIRRLIVLGDPDAETLLAAQAAADRSDEGRRLAYAAHTGLGNPDIKRQAFHAFLKDAQLPERWIEDSLAPFNAVEQESITLPWLAPALEALPELRRRHKIFFVNDWVAAFVGGQRSAQALEVVRQVLRAKGLSTDIERKLLEAGDDLERTVRVRARYAGVGN